MNFKDKNYIVIVCLLLVVSVISLNLYFKNYQAKDTVDIFRFPQTIDSWTSEDLAISDDEYAILETRNAFIRKYTHTDGREVYLFIVYSQNNRKVSHPPEVCYIGGGVSVLGKVADTIPAGGPTGGSMAANKLRLQKGNLEETAFYWFKVGDTFTSSYWQQQFLIALKTFLGRPSSSALIRVSADITQKGEKNTTQMIKEFSSRIIPELNRYLP